jgi:drug/metabolite transporter (DMT)-like permease
MRTQFSAVAFALLASLLAAAATFEIKRGAASTRLSLAHFHLSPRVPVAVVLYLVSSVFFLLSLRRAQISVILPITALEYLWVLLLARYGLDERIGGAKALGLASIILGLVLVGLGS